MRTQPGSSVPRRRHELSGRVLVHDDRRTIVRVIHRDGEGVLRGGDIVRVRTSAPLRSGDLVQLRVDRCDDRGTIVGHIGMIWFARDDEPPGSLG